MQAEESAPKVSSPRARIIWLVCIHIALGLLLGAITATTESDPDLLSASFMGLVLSQTSLLGIWGGSGTNRWWIRLVGILVGVGYLGPQFGFCINEPTSEFVWLFAFTTLIVLVPLQLARCFGLRTRHDSDQKSPAKEMQFSIRHMMILTLVVACLLALAKWQQPYLLFGDFFLWVLSMCFATVGLVAAWGVLGAKRPLIGIPVLLAVAVGAGYGLEKSLGPLAGFAILVTVTLTEALSLTVSLLVVRSWGYRLRRRVAQHPGSHSEEIKNQV
jgi:hypothetical protein